MFLQFYRKRRVEREKFFLFICRSGSDMMISGDSLIQAVENNFQRIASAYHIGNSAGYALNGCTWNGKTAFLGGKGGVELRITARGSDALVGYDPVNDIPRDTVIWIHANRDDLPEPHEFEISRTSPPEATPFDAVETAGPPPGMLWRS